MTQILHQRLKSENSNITIDKAMTACDSFEALAVYVQYKDKIIMGIVDRVMPNMDKATTINQLQK
ncbi:MAG: hypothetical protein PUP93_09085 [Rhizonema sp. NSF051]|nr:hypothetical protein [Rhizonema sp. NSF051]